MLVIQSDKTLFVDVDNTLVLWDEAHTTYRPHQRHIDMMKKFHARKQPIIVWSAGGYEWAQRVVRELGLENIVTAVMSKPAWYIDDLTASEILPEINRIYLPEHETIKPHPIREMPV